MQTLRHINAVIVIVLQFYVDMTLPKRIAQ